MTRQRSSLISASGTPWAGRNFRFFLPITTGGEFPRRIHFAVPISGFQTTGVVRCDPPCVLDLHERNGRRIDTLPPEILVEVLARLARHARNARKGPHADLICQDIVRAL